MLEALDPPCLSTNVDMADYLSTGKMRATSMSFFEKAFTESRQEVKRWRRVIYLPGCW
jgi:hypothetical protein